MTFTRIIPVLLIQDDVLVKTARFKAPVYIGDPINAIKIFNEKEVDELVVLDISATKKKKINFDLLSRINKEAFMPLAYGGGITTAEDAQKIFALGYEKVILNNMALKQPELITKIAGISGNQSVVICIDIKKNLLGKYYVYDYLQKKFTSRMAVDWAKECEQKGAGEIVLHDVEKEGTFTGYNLKMITAISDAINIPVIALGGAANVDDLKAAIQAGASAVAAGSMFVFHGPHRAVLITYPDKSKTQIGQ
jgi:cyclase